MKFALTVFVTLPLPLTLMGCSQESAALSPGAPQISREIGVGEEVNDTLPFNGPAKLFELVTTSDGTLVAQLTWDPGQCPLELYLADRLFSHNFHIDSSYIVGELPVVTAPTRTTEGPESH